MKKYIYTADPDATTVITDFEEENYILVKKNEQPGLVIKKHEISVENGNVLQRTKAKDFISIVRKNIIKEGLKFGTCKEL